MNEGLPCEIQCMIFNETAYAIGRSISDYYQGKMKPRSIVLDQFDMSNLQVGKFQRNPVICKDGWGLNDF